MNRIRTAWAAGAPAVGRWQTSADQLEAERIGGLGYDFVLLDYEGPRLDPASFVALTQAVELGGTRTMVRVPSHDPAGIMRFLDAGAIGVVVPMVRSVEEALHVAEATRYPPAGRRSNGHVRRPAGGYAEMNEDVVCIVMIEDADGWADLERIAAVPGVDGVMIGQVDLALSLGWPMSPGGGIDVARHEQARAALERVVEVTARHGTIAAAAGSGADDEGVRILLEAGVRWYGAVDGEPGADQRQAARVAGWRRDHARPAARR